MIKGNLLMQKTAVFFGILIMLILLSPIFVYAADGYDVKPKDLQDVFNELDPSEEEQVTIQMREQVTIQEKGYWDIFWAHLNIFSASSLQIPPPSELKPTAYIMVGDTSSTLASALELARKWSYIINSNKPYISEKVPYNQLMARAPAKYPIDEEPFKLKLIRGIVAKSQSLLQAAGYKLSNIRIERRATAAMLSGVLKNPTVGALIWIGHGQPGKVVDMTTDNRTGIISKIPVQRWALDFLKEKGIYKSPASYPRSSGMFKAMVRIQNRAHFGLNYFYSHSCLTMQDPGLAIAMLAGSGRYEGYIEKKLAYVAALTPAVSRAVNQELPDVHSLVVMPDVKGLDKTAARNELQGFHVKIIEDREDEYAAGQVYAQHPAEGTILDKYRSKMHVKLNVYKQKSDADDSEAQDDDSQDDENSGNDKPSLIRFDPMYLIHVTRTYTSYGPIDKDVYFLHPAKPVDGKITSADGGGGTFTYEGEAKGGPYTDNHTLCPVLKSLGATSAILPNNRTIDCSDPWWKAQ